MNNQKISHHNKVFKHLMLFFLLAVLAACGGGKSQTGSCNQFCGGTQRISGQTQGACADLGARSTCPTQWLPHGANPDDRNAWITVYPVPVDTGSTPEPDTTPPPQPDLAIEFTADNEISLVITRGNISEPYGNDYEVYRNGTLITTKYNYSQRFDRMLDELTEYCYSVVSIDSSGNRSVNSVEHCLTTPVSPLKSSTEFSLDQNSSGSVVASDGTIYGGRALNALNPDGTLKWTSSLAGNYAKPVIGNDGVIYSYNNNTVYALFSDGAVSWSYQLSRPISSIDVSNDTVYVSAYEILVIDAVAEIVRNITALNLDGTFKWKYVDATNRSISLGLLGADGTPYLLVRNSAGAAHQIQALNSNGTLKWEYVDTNNSGLILITVGNDGKSYVEAKATGTTVAEDVYKFQVINVTGTLDWEYTLPSRIKDVEIAADGSVYLSSYSPKFTTSQSVASIEALNSNGVFKWNYTVDRSNAGLYSYVLFDDILLASDGKLYFSDGYKLHSLNPDGTTNWISEGSYTVSYQPWKLQIINNNSLIYLDRRQGNVKIVSYGVDGIVNWRYAMRDEDAYSYIGPSGPAASSLNRPLQVLNEILIFGDSKLLAFDAGIPR